MTSLMNGPFTGPLVSDYGMKYSVVLIYFIYPTFIFGHILSELQNIEKLRKQFSALRAELDQPKPKELLNKSGLKIDLFYEFSQNRPNSRGTRSACDNGKGNYGINSFNFMAFILLTFNVVANVNNNLNNNNNNKNDNNINAISQNSNNVATNTNAANQIGVTVLPIPGKRSLGTV